MQTDEAKWRGFYIHESKAVESLETSTLCAGHVEGEGKKNDLEYDLERYPASEGPASW